MNGMLQIVADVVRKNAIAGAASVKGPTSPRFLPPGRRQSKKERAVFCNARGLLPLLCA